MTVDDRTRLNLHRRLETVLGSEEADTLMAHLPPVTWQQVATKDDLRVLSAEVRTEIAQVEARFERAIRRQTLQLGTFLGAWSALLVSVVGLLR